MRNLLDVTQLRESVLQSLDACRISSKAYVKEKFGGKADFCVEVAVPKRYVTKVEQPKGQEWRHVYLVKNYDLQFPLRPMEEIMVHEAKKPTAGAAAPADPKAPDPVAVSGCRRGELPPTGWSTKWTPATKHAALLAAIEESWTSLTDWSVLDKPMDLQLVLLPFGYASSTQATELVNMASSGRDSEVEELLHERLDPDITHNRGSWLFSVCRESLQGRASTVKLLLEAKACTDKVSERNRLGTALNVACFAGHSGVTQLLLEARAEVQKVPGHGELPLNLACFKGSAEVVRHLLEAKADKDACGQQGFTPLLEACSRGNMSVVRLLLESRANVDKVCCSDDVSYGETPLYVAARSGYVEVVRLLLQAGADTEKICGMQGVTAADMARRKSRMQTWSQMHVVYALRPQSDVWQESIQSVSLEQAELDRLMREKMSSKPRPTQKHRVKEAITWLLEAGADLEVLCADGNSEVRSGAASLLAELGPENGGSRAVALLQSSDAQARATAAEAIGRLGREAASHAEAVVALLGDSETTVRMAAVAAIGKLGPAAAKFCASALGSEKPLERMAACEALGHFGNAAVEHAAAVAGGLALAGWCGV
eukprot:s5934_g5.t1